MTLFPPVIAILPAAGIGRRMNHQCPKQYLTICNKSILEYAISALLGQPCIKQIIVAINKDDRWFNQLAVASEPRVRVVTGGLRRADSVMAALHYADDIALSSSWVLVHDAVRPCLHQDDLLRLLAITISSKVGGILATPVRDTMKLASNSDNTITIDSSVERNNLWHALTPQLFVRQLLKNCISKALAKGATITDEASALEYCGYKPILVPGRADNIKVTHIADLKLVRCYLLDLLKVNGNK